jgi:hypothetical protein
MQITGWSFASTASHYIGCTKVMSPTKAMPLYPLGARHGD